MQQETRGLRRIREVDDLHLVECQLCGGKGNLGRDRNRCPRCNGTGDRVIHRVKYSVVPIRKGVRNE